MDWCNPWSYLEVAGSYAPLIGAGANQLGKIPAVENLIHHGVSAAQQTKAWGVAENALNKATSVADDILEGLGAQYRVRNIDPSGRPPGVHFANRSLDGSTVGRTENCVNCVVAGDAAFEGRRATALPSDGAVPNGLAKLQEHFKAQNGGDIFRYMRLNKIDEVLLKAGDGARGIVYVQWRRGGAAHVFNAINDRGRIKYIDAQTGRKANLNPGIKESNTAFMRTNT